MSLGETLQVDLRLEPNWLRWHLILMGLGLRVACAVAAVDDPLQRQLGIYAAEGCQSTVAKAP